MGWGGTGQGWLTGVSPTAILCAASLVYRLPQAWLGPRLPWKALHAALHLVAFVFTMVGLVAVFGYHSHTGVAHLYSLHSWLGLAAVILFACQVGAHPALRPLGTPGPMFLFSEQWLR